MHRFGHPWAYEHIHGYEFDWWPGMLLSALSTIFWVALFIGLAWALLRWVFPYILPIMTDMFSNPADPPALEILRQRFAAGEIDAVTFEQMRERLEASYQQAGDSILHDDNGYLSKNWTGYRDTFPSPGSREQESIRMAAQEGYPSETEP
jgi:uncharacterized membrane protein